MGERKLMGNGIKSSSQPAVIILGGGHNSLSIATSLGSRGINVFSLNHPGSLVSYSRYASDIALPREEKFVIEAERYLKGTDSDSLRGSVLLAASDEGLKMIAMNRSNLAERFLLDASDTNAQLQMLDKLSTYQAAREAGVPTPKFWSVRTVDEAEEARSSMQFPIIVKPHHSYLFESRHKRKYIEIDDFDGLADALSEIRACGTEALLMEKIPGPDHLLCSYYTYIDESGAALFDFTKRVIRRYPKNMGLATYAVTDYVPELKDLSLRLFHHVGLRGIGNVEFKRDERDGQLKLIECNARFTAADKLMRKSGLDLAWFVYSRIVGLPLPDMSRFEVGCRMWDPIRDFMAFRELTNLDELTVPEWLKSIMRPTCLPVYSVGDPLPSLYSLASKGLKLVPSRIRNDVRWRIKEPRASVAED